MTIKEMSLLKDILETLINNSDIPQWERHLIDILMEELFEDG